VLFISGHAGAEVCRFYGLVSPDLHFLEKPFDPIDLLVRVCRVLFSTEPFRFDRVASRTSGTQG
jgi:hypothetical protein